MSSQNNKNTNNSNNSSTIRSNNSSTRRSNRNRKEPERFNPNDKKYDEDYNDNLYISHPPPSHNSILSYEETEEISNIIKTEMDN